MNDDGLQLHPEVQRVLDENQLLREELAAELAELQDLEHIERPHLIAIYQSKLGPWDLRLLRAQCELARLRRTAELIQASLNRGEAPNLREIEGMLDLELLAWQQRLKEAAERITGAQFRLSHLLSAADDAALKKLYRILVKKLHPDLNPGQSRERSNSWLQVVAAYEAGDLERLKALAHLPHLSGAGESSTATRTLDELMSEHGRLREQVLLLLEQIGAIRRQPPFSLRRQWEDHAWVEQRRAEVEAQIATANENALALEKHVKSLLIVHAPGRQFGSN
jgi:hypothetical protein